MRIAFLTAGGIAPCLSASIGGLIRSYNTSLPDADFIGYLNGYKGLLTDKKISFPASVKKKQIFLNNTEVVRLAIVG